MNFSRSKQVIFGGVTLVVIAVLILLRVDRTEPTIQSAEINTPRPSDAGVDAITQFKQIKTLKNADIALANAQKLLAQPAPNPSEKKLLDESMPWQLNSADETIKPSIPLNENVMHFAAVKLNPHPDHMPNEGEKIQLPMLNGRSLTANVESVTTTANGDYIWTGHLDGQGTDFPIVMTYGEKLTFATINTPEGSYSLESANGVGWLYKNPTVADLSAPGSVDSLEPPLNPLSVN